ncbi:hypothetical protein [Microbacterium sp.]|uniref:hypothetical protein n=1 Tax=Microbacterium sp. TaxID=51671 RepID=UPI0039E27482
MTGVGRADALVAEMLGILTRTREARQHPPAVERMLAESMSTAGILSEQLAELQQFVILEAEEPDTNEMIQARTAWDQLPADVDAKGVRELVLLSPTLSTLHRAAVTVTSVHRFGDEKLKMAAFMGQVAGRFPRYIGMLVPRPNDKFPGFFIDASELNGMERLLERLAHVGAIKDFKLLGQFKNKEGKQYWKERSEVPKHRTAEKWRVLRGTVASDWEPFLTGHWLTAYAYQIARDQFERVGAAFEIYSNVRYSLPGDLGGGSSDVDVLVRTSDIVLSIECKSGHVLTGQPSQASKTLRNAERFDRILDTMEVSLKRIYQLLYLESDKEPAEDVSRAVTGGKVDLLVTMPRAVRLTVQRIANGQSIDDYEQIGAAEA